MFKSVVLVTFALVHINAVADEKDPVQNKSRDYEVREYLDPEVGETFQVPANTDVKDLLRLHTYNARTGAYTTSDQYHSCRFSLTGVPAGKTPHKNLHIGPTQTWKVVRVVPNREVEVKGDKCMIIPAGEEAVCTIIERGEVELVAEGTKLKLKIESGSSVGSCLGRVGFPRKEKTSTETEEWQEVNSGGSPATT
jgi:hypothetical protein